MQEMGRWRVAAKNDLLIGSEPSPARIVKTSETNFHTTDFIAVDARNTVSFRDTLYCGRQDGGYVGVRKRLSEYYRFMFSKIPLWAGFVVQQSVEKTEEPEAFTVKKEEYTSDLPVSSDNVSLQSYRAVGILTQTSNPGVIGEELLLPWEFFPITDFDDVDAYTAPIAAFTKEVSHFGGLLHMAADPEEREAGEGATGQAVSNNTFNGHGDVRLSLYTRLVSQFTGIYPGMAVGVIGDPFKRSSSGVLTAVLVRQFILPTRPIFPWSVERPLSVLPVSLAIPTRVQFCSGPFPRRDICSILNAVTLNALTRGADLLIVGGPLVKEFEDFEKNLLTKIQVTFGELLGTYMDTIEETLDNYYAVNGKPHNRSRLKVILVSHRDDVTQVPALPTTMYGVKDGTDVWVRSNPCRVSVNGIHFGVCNEDVVGDMRDRMVERWPTEAGSLRRVVESLIQSRLYAPIYELPSGKHELKHLHTLRIDYMPEIDATVAAADSNNDNESVNGKHTGKESWNSVFSIVNGEHGRINDMKSEGKRVKKENDESLCFSHCVSDDENAVEWMPHVLFLPSARPQFAFVTHRSVWDDSKNMWRDECELDDATGSSGVMVVNQEIWSRRSATKFELRVAEVTIPNSLLVMCRGASAANGVSCSIIHLTSNVGNSTD